MAKQKITALAYDKRGRLLSVGHNSYTKTHTLQAQLAFKSGEPSKIYLHAELDALLKARHPVHTLKIFRLNAKGEYVNAAPCPICQLAIAQFKVKKVIHT